MTEIPKNFAYEYVFLLNGETIIITRYNNHRSEIADKKWAACWVRGSLNPWYLNANGEWKYKSGCTYETADEAYEHCLQFPPEKNSTIY